MKKALHVNYPEFEIDSVIDEDLEKELQKITYDKITSSSTSRTIKNIRKNLSATLKAKYDINDTEKLNEVTSKILKIHGLHEDNFDFVKKFEDGLLERINDFSIDDNSNKNEKVMRGYLNEVEKPVDKLIGYDVLYRTLKDLYGEKEAKRLTGEMYDYSLGLSDSSNILVPYCWSLDASKLVTQGRNFGVLPSKPCKRVSSYISSLCETIHQMSNHLAGAIAIGTFFLDLAHILIYKERRTLNEVKIDKKIRKYIENELQQFIHSVNHLSRNGAESPFTNVSIFDSVKLKGLIDKDNYAWYFPNLKAISTDNDLDDKMSDEEFNQYVIDYIMTIQNLYMDFFEKGDPLNNGMPYRFPVSTVNFSKKEENGELIIEDSKFLKEFRKRDAFRFNLFNSMGTKICSCCFNGDEVIEIENKSGEKTITSIQDFVNIYSNNNEGEYDVNDEIFIKSLDENNEMSKSKIIGVLNKKNGYNEMIDIEVGDHKISVTPDHIFKVKDKITNDIKEITAEELMNNKEKYMVPVI